MKTREFPAQPVVDFSVSAGVNTAATGQNLVEGADHRHRVAGLRRQRAAAAHQREGRGRSPGHHRVGDERPHRLVPQRVESDNSGDGAPNGGIGLSLGGETPVFGQPIGLHRLVELRTEPGNPGGMTRGLAKNGSEPGTGRCPTTPTTGSAAPRTACSGAGCSISAPGSGRDQARRSTTPTPERRQRGPRLAGANEEFSVRPADVARLDVHRARGALEPAVRASTSSAKSSCWTGR